MQGSKTKKENFRFVEIALPVPLRRTFTYRLPSNQRQIPVRGTRMTVPFGTRILTGFAVEFHETLDEKIGIVEGEIKEVREILEDEPLITDEILRLTNWAAEYYAASWGEILKAALPAGVSASTEKLLALTELGRNEFENPSRLDRSSVAFTILSHITKAPRETDKQFRKLFRTAAQKRALLDLVNAGFVETHLETSYGTQPKKQKIVRLISDELESPNTKKPSAAQNRVIDTLLSEHREMLLTELITHARVSPSVVKTLESHGIVQIHDKEILRDPLKGESAAKEDELELNADQKNVFDQIESALQHDKFDAFLLHGVTSSGKTEVYIRAMRAALAMGKSSLMLVPEISLTPIFSRRLRSHFGGEVAILHSSLSAGERFDEWRRIRNGTARIAIGTRSAIFAPLEDLGLIIVDEEHDASYRQQESPYYNARDIALVRAQQGECVVVLGSATPALETYFNAEKGKYKLVVLPERINRRPFAKAELIDMRSVFKTLGKDPIFSPQIVEAIGETHAKGEQTIILLNRRGYSNFIMCRSCGETIRCTNCDISLTFHKHNNLLVCHYCNFRRAVPGVCPTCQSQFIYFVGEGTEKIEDILKNKFSELRIARLDRDTAMRRSQFEETILSFSERNIDLLVGTQMLAKGHDFPNVTLVGVVSVDNILGLPDFRSAERTFQLLTQVAGRAGRGSAPGKVLIQTFYPDHYAIRHAAKQDYEGFYREEIRFRKNFNYPPFVALASLIIHHKNYNYAFDNAQILREEMEKARGEFNVRILGVAPAPLARLKNEHRLQILVKAVKRSELRKFLDIAFEKARARVCDLRTVNLEIDPVSLM